MKVVKNVYLSDGQVIVLFTDGSTQVLYEATEGSIDIEDIKRELDSVYNPLIKSTTNSYSFSGVSTSGTYNTVYTVRPRFEGLCLINVYANTNAHANTQIRVRDDTKTLAIHTLPVRENSNSYASISVIAYLNYSSTINIQFSSESTGSGIGVQGNITIVQLN